MLRLLLILVLLSVSSSWVIHNRESRLRNKLTVFHSEPSDINIDNELNPCWQDIYDADCTMDSIFSARFVPSEWIKQLPCGSGMQDCDFPDDALLPEIRHESHAEINVIEFLNIKRVDDSKRTTS
mmetsp:Transcript_2913/g.8003  ORF Transcript_2913/g.8003 Transcript_2913/m.8003 type:complete len:125 (-) Transcript_2913:197-571(-)